MYGLIGSSQIIGASLLLSLWLLPAGAEAGKLAYGEHFVRAGQRWAEAEPLQSSGGSIPLPQERNLYQRQLDELQDNGGPYSDALAEPLTALGRHYRASGELDRALSFYRRALHIVRINDGLYSERQIPVLQELLGMYRDTGDLKALNQRYEYYFRLLGNGQPPFTEVRLQAALGYLRWQREALRLGLDENEDRRLWRLYQLNGRLLQMTAQDPEVSWKEHSAVVISQMRNLYLIDDRIKPRLENIGVVASSPISGGEWEQEDFELKRLESLQRSAVGHGRELMEQLITRGAGQAAPEDLARLHLELADWYQWHGSPRASQQYAAVESLLLSAGRDDLLQEWLGQPVELPDNGVFRQSVPASVPRRPVVLQVSYDVSAEGRIDKVQASQVGPDEEQLASRLVRRLKQVRFRPRWKEGTAVAAPGVQREYELFD